jgi:hypothetical protein
MSWGILFSLLRETGYAKMLLARSDLNLELCLKFISRAGVPDLSTTREIMSLVEQNSDPIDNSSAFDLGMICHNFWLQSRRVGVQFPKESISEELRQFVLFCKKRGMLFKLQYLVNPPILSDYDLKACGGKIAYFLERFEYMVVLYLETGGNPNSVFDGYSLLAKILAYMGTQLINGKLEDDYNMAEEEVGNPDERSGRLCTKYSTRLRCVHLLTLLISSGANIYWFCTDDSVATRYHGMFCIASKFSVLGILLASLRESGFPPMTY